MSDVIETERCKLTPLSVADREHVKALYRCTQTRRYLGGPLDDESFAQCFAGMLDDKEAENWTFKLKNTGSFLGLVCLGRHHDGEGYEISYQMLPAFGGQGLSYEAVSALISRASKVLKLPRLLAETQVANLASRKLLERLGMKPLRSVTRFDAEQVIYHLIF